jgi:hypothetical protein
MEIIYKITELTKEAQNLAIRNLTKDMITLGYNDEEIYNESCIEFALFMNVPFNEKGNYIY